MPPYPVVLELGPGVLPTMLPSGEKGWA